MPLSLGVLFEVTGQPWGGVNTFFRNFYKKAESDHRVILVGNFRKAEVLISAGHRLGPNKELSSRQFKRLKSGGLLKNVFRWKGGTGTRKIIVRLDGLKRLYAPEAAAQDDLLIQNVGLADSVIFQSRFSKMCFDKEGISYPNIMSVIPNGADTSVFYPPKEYDRHLKKVSLISSSWSTNLRKGYETIARFSESSLCQVSHIGRWPNAISPKNVRLLGTLDQSSIAEVLRHGDCFLFPSELEACPNVVVEALVTGLPVIYHPSGGTIELCQYGRFGIPLPDVMNEFAVESVLDQVIEQYSELREITTDHIKHFSFDRCYESYLRHIFNHCGVV